MKREYLVLAKSLRGPYGYGGSCHSHNPVVARLGCVLDQIRRSEMKYAEFLETVGCKFVDIMNATRDREYTYTFKAWEIGIFHGLIALAADHPGIQNMSPYTHAQIDKFRAWCKRVWEDMGMTEEEAELLDRLREGNDGDSSV